mgnify:FL=1
MADGLPINQEDLAATLMCFSTVILAALDRSSLAVTADERAAWMHLWKVVGALLGIAPALLPVDEADGKALMDAVRRRHWSASPQGATLGRALVSCMADYMPAPWLQRLPVALIRHLGGDRCADLLGLPPSSLPALLVEAAGDLLGAAGPGDRGDPLLCALDRFSAALMKALVSVQRGGKQAPFRIPASLRST